VNVVLNQVLHEVNELMIKAYLRRPEKDREVGEIMLNQVVNLISANLGVMNTLSRGDEALCMFIKSMRDQPQDDLENFVMLFTIVAAACFKQYGMTNKMPGPTLLAAHAAMYAGVEMNVAPEIPETTDVEAAVTESLFLCSVYGGCPLLQGVINDLCRRLCEYTSAHHLATINAIHSSWPKMNCSYQFRTLLAAIELASINIAHGPDASLRIPAMSPDDDASAQGPPRTLQ
jgi:hypothetical protein